MRKMRLLAVGLVMTLSLTGCGLLDSLPAVFDVEQEGADFDAGKIEFPEISLDDIQMPEFSLGDIHFPEISLEDFKLGDFLSGEFEFPEISLEDFKEPDPSDTVTDEEKEVQYKEYLLNLWQKLLENQEGIKDVDLNFEDIAGGEKLNVDIDFDELVGDKEAIMEEIAKALEKFFGDFENLTIDIKEE